MLGRSYAIRRTRVILRRFRVEEVQMLEGKIHKGGMPDPKSMLTEHSFIEIPCQTLGV